MQPCNCRDLLNNAVISVLSECCYADKAVIEVTVWVEESLRRKKIICLSSYQLYLIEKKNRKKDASCLDSCSQFSVSSKVNILSQRKKIIIWSVKTCLSKHYILQPGEEGKDRKRCLRATIY